MSRHLFSALLYLSTAFIVLRLLWRSIKAPNYRKRILERFGFISITPKPNTLWIHCVSVGETLAAAPFIEALLTQKPHYSLLITSTTPTGSAQVQRLFGDRVQQSYIPYDLPIAIAWFLRRVQPKMALIIETEVWPNMIHLCQKNDIPTALINARMSAKSHKGYGRLSSLSQTMFASLDFISAQSDADAQRLRDLGAANVTVTGSIKNDFIISEAMRAQAKKQRQQWEQERGEALFCLIAASTHSGEDEIILEAFKTIHQQHPNTLLILVPRHPERFDTVFALSEKAGFNTSKRTDNILDVYSQVLIGNTMGELQMLFGTADIAIMGGTFIDNGGHNFLEPAAWAIPILSGKSVFNFAQISDALIANGALQIVDDAQQLQQAASTLIEEISLREQRGKAALDYIEQNRGVVEQNLALLEPFLG